MALVGLCYEPGKLRQNLLFSLFSTTALIGFLPGPLFSGLLSDLAWWSWPYLVMAAARILLSVMDDVVFPEPHEHDRGPGRDGYKSSTWQSVDIFGSATGVKALVLLNFARNQGTVVGWPTPRVQHPLVPFGAAQVDTLFTLSCVSAGWSSFRIFVHYMRNALVVLRGQSILTSSAQLMPISICGILAALTTGLSLCHFRALTVTVFTMLTFLVGGILFATMQLHQTYGAQTLVGIVLFPWNMDISCPAATIVLSQAMLRHIQGPTGSLVTTFVN
ncbi:uncharacterized protein V1518DRAFT_444630 [Limtongia smithiae]|uniref:uncharacterized protein n=1 Tax=Limtongia smithiae TaxID=1125753 RepID=UPI0034CEEC5B